MTTQAPNPPWRVTGEIVGLLWRANTKAVWVVLKTPLFTTKPNNHAGYRWGVKQDVLVFNDH